MAKQDLKYLFHAVFADGGEFIQDPDDVSKIDPIKRSQYYDLLQEVENGRVIRLFSLVGEGHIITVDLGTGLFYFDGFKILLEGDKLPTLPDKFTLIFYRQWTQSVNVDYKANKKGEMELISAAPTGEKFCEYFIGWQCNIKKKNYQQKIAVS